MENKTTVELLKILHEKGTGSGEDYNQETYEQAFAELRKRSPFWELFDEDWEEGIPAILERLKDLEDEVKRLKRHKHDDTTGDVMIRI